MSKRIAVCAVLLSALIGSASAQPLALGPASSDDTPSFSGSGTDLGQAFGELGGALKARPIKSVRPPSSGGGEPIRIISWNVRTFGRSVKEERAAAFDSILSRLFSENHNAKVLAIQEVSNEGGSTNFNEMLPGGDSRWNPSFDNTEDSQDNAFYTQTGVQVDCEKFVFDSGSAKSKHPVRAAHMRIGDLDFTILTLHLAFKNGDADDSKRELRHALNWLKGYLADPTNDPDVILAGDFNLPTRAGKAQSVRSSEGKWSPIEDVLETYPEFKDGGLVALVDDKTSRRKGEAANNYDHFIVTKDLYNEEYVVGSAGIVPTSTINRVEGQRGVMASDHYPISARFRIGGEGGDSRVIHQDGPGRFCEQ
jgi:exonuclease III